MSCPQEVYTLEGEENKKPEFAARAKKSCKWNAMQGKPFGRNLERFPGGGARRGDGGDWGQFRSGFPLPHSPLCLQNALVCKMSAPARLFWDSAVILNEVHAHGVGPCKRMTGWRPEQMDSSKAGRHIKRKDMKWHDPRNCHGERVGERRAGKDYDVLSTVNCPAFQMSPEDTATISMQPDSAQWVHILAWLVVIVETQTKAVSVAELVPGFQRKRIN